MSTVIVNEDYNSESEGQDALFKDLTFWVHQRVPLRRDWLQRIKENGGHVKPLEKHADIIIADHARKDAPAGSVSWKWIEESIKRGELCNKDDYRINGQAPASRPVGSTQLPKATRNPFTQQEDREFAKWVIQQEHSGRKSNGNQIFQEYAEDHPTHTWQSWRDRWVKTLSLLYKRQPQQADPPSSPPPPPTKEPVKRRGPLRPPVDPDRVVKPRFAFTEEDDQILREWVKAYGAAGASGNKIYQNLEEEHPHHTAHSWRDRWLRHLSKRNEEPAKSDKTPNPHPPAISSRSPPQPLQHPSRPSPAVREAAPDNTPQAAPRGIMAPPNLSGRSTPQDSTTPKASLVSGTTSRHSPESSLLEAVMVIQRVWRGYSARQKLSDFFTLMHEHFIPTAKGMIMRRYYPKVKRAHLVSKVNEDCFRDYLEQFQAIEGLPEVTHVDILGKEVDLWDLWSAATFAETSPEMRDWDYVYKELCWRLKLSPLEGSRIPQELKAAFHEHLAGFEEVMADWAEDNLTVCDESEIGHEIEAVKEEAENPSDREGHQAEDGSQHETNEEDERASIKYDEFPSSPPITGSKRSFAQSSFYSAGDLSSKKRPRFQLGEEIPCTPDPKSQRRQPSPSSILDSSPSRARLKRQASRLPMPTTSQTKIVEPETQDFEFYQDGGAIDDMSPSQQLRSEDHQHHFQRAPDIVPSIETPSTGTRLQNHVHGWSVVSKKPSSREDTARRPQRGPFLEDSSDDSDAFAPATSTPRGRSPISSKPKGKSNEFSKRTANGHPQKKPQLLVRKPRQSTGSNLSAAANSSPSYLVGVSSTPLRPSIASRTAANVSFAAGPPWVPSGTLVGAKKEEVKPWVDYYVSLGYDPHTVCKALEATNFVIRGAPEVMQSLKEGKGMPEKKGVWTERDDHLVRELRRSQSTKSESSRIENVKGYLISKHGAKELDTRLKWLAKKDKQLSSTPKASRRY